MWQFNKQYNQKQYNNKQYNNKQNNNVVKIKQFVKKNIVCKKVIDFQKPVQYECF